jgi:hypothetical protein
MPQEVRWTREMQANTLSVIDIVKALVSTDDPQRNVAAGTREVVKLVPRQQDDEAFASVAPGIIAGLGNIAAMLAEQLARDTGVSVEQVLDNVTEAVQTVTIID